MCGNHPFGEPMPVGQCSHFSFAVEDNQGFVVARCSNALVTMSSERSEANARLIASSPELLSACEAALRFLESTGFTDMKERFVPINGSEAEVRAMKRTCASRIEELRAAIAKAEGKP